MIALVVGAALVGLLLMVACVAVLVNIEGGEAKGQFDQIQYCLDHPDSPKCATPSP
jgi:hypothetical protein